MSDKTSNCQPQLLSAGELAKMLSTSVRTVWRLRSAGKLPEPLSIGGSVKWLLSDIRQWIEWNCCSRAEFIARKAMR